MTICLAAHVFDHLHQVLIISRNEAATLIQRGLIERRPAGPVGTKVDFLTCLLLPHVPQPYPRTVTQAKSSATLVSITCTDHNFSHWYSLLCIPGGIRLEADGLVTPLVRVALVS